MRIKPTTVRFRGDVARILARASREWGTDRTEALHRIVREWDAQQGGTTCRKSRSSR